MKILGQTGRSNKALITAKFYGINIETPAFNMGVDNKTPEFLKKNPTGKVPVLETEEGSIFESNAIVRYIARVGGDKAKLYGRSAFEAGQIDQWIDFSVNEIELPGAAWLYPIFGFIQNNPVATKKAQEDIKRVLQILDSHLLTRTYLVGRSISIADIVVATSLQKLYENVLDATFRSEFVNVNRWFVTYINQPEVKSVVGEVVLCETAKVAAAPAKKEKAPKEDKPKPAPVAAKKEAKKPEPKDDDEEEEGDKEEKKKNPLDALPKSNFVMDEWKRMYSNNDTRAVALPWFFEHYDPTGYCMYWCSYKYNDELSKTFMTSNLIGGFFQRLEKLHKYAFGSVIIFGEEPKLEVHGVWVFRGQEIPADMKDCDDSEHYTWTPVDLSDAAQKKKVEDYFAWDGELEGKKFVAGKTFK